MRVLLLTMILCAPPKDVSVQTDNASVDDLKTAVEQMRADLKAMRLSLEAIQQRLDNERSPTIFTPVSVRVEDEDGQPLPGFHVKMRSAEKGVRQVEVTGHSDDTGLALTRDLPYGRYYFWVEEQKQGWYSRLNDVTVELGKPFERTIIAPNPDAKATVTLRSRLDPAAFEGLRFGQFQSRRTRGSISSPLAPEPGAEEIRFESFPTFNNGIDKVAVKVRLGMSRTISQGDDIEMTWRVSENSMLMATPFRFIVVGDTKGESMVLPRETPYFSPTDERFEDSDYQVGYIVCDDVKSIEGEYSLELPAGELEVRLVRFYGKAGPAAAESLRMDGQSDQEIWLDATLKATSQWVPRILDLTNWHRGTGISHLAMQTHTIEANRDVEITIASPNTANGDE